MAFEDLAKHMAARDGRKGSTSADPTQMLAESAAADRRMARTRDLVLGPLLLVGGLAIGALGLTVGLGDRSERRFLALFFAAAGIGIVAGALMIHRGLGGRSNDPNAPEHVLDRLFSRFR